MSTNRKKQQYINMCIETAKIFSTCGKKKYAAVLVDKNDHIVGIGYNGGPRGFKHCEDGGCPRFQQMSESGSNYDNCIAVHAEANAFLHSDYSSHAYSLYVNGPPCFSCAKLIANSTVEHVYYIKDSSYKDWDNVNDFLSKSNVTTHEIEL
jgi:dCMP deaminase